LDYLVYCAGEQVIRSSEECRAEQIASGVGNKAGMRARTIRAIGERAKADQGLRGARVAARGLDDLEHRALVVVPSTPERCPKPFICAVADEGGPETRTICTIGERAKAPQGLRGVGAAIRDLDDLKHRTSLVRPAT